MVLHEGLIWFDNRPRVTFGDKVREAAAAYERRFRRRATVCYVNPQDLPGTVAPLAGLDVIGEPTVLRHHFFVGVQRPGRGVAAAVDMDNTASAGGKARPRPVRAPRA